MKTIIWKQVSAEEKKNALARPAHKDDTALAKSVAEILYQVQQCGDEALRELSLKFDKASIKNLRIASEEIAQAVQEIDPQLRIALDQAKFNIEKFHQAQIPKNIKTETMPGVVCELQWRTIETVGLYIPGGTAPLFSALLMQAIPARIAGCQRIILCTPPGRDGKIHKAILAAAYLCGIQDVFAVGGAQAIAAMAYGTETVPKVDKIFGPGNAYVTSAKQQVSQDPNGAAIDMPAGPSEVMVMADQNARVDWVAADLLAQAEHDTTAQAILVTTDASFAKKVQQEIEKQLAVLPRQSIAAQSIAHSRMIVVSNGKESIIVANAYAPEHLIIHDEDAARLLPQIRNAGSVFLGAWTPESAGDYASGTNHVLPTYGYARAYSGLSVLSFMKSMSVQSLTQDGLQRLAPTIIAMAEAEGLQAHAHAVKIRLLESHS